MNIHGRQTIASLPALKLRAFFRQHERWNVEHIVEHFQVPTVEAAIIATNLEREGLAQNGDEQRFWGCKWRATPAARRIALAKATPLVDRARAESELLKLVQRAKQVNRKSTFLYRVKRIDVFGS